MHWQKSGDFLCVKVDRYSKVRKEKHDIKYSVSLIFSSDKAPYVEVPTESSNGFSFHRACITTSRFST